MQLNVKNLITKTAPRIWCSLDIGSVSGGQGGINLNIILP